MTKEEFKKIKDSAQSYAWAIVWNTRNTIKQDREKFFIKEQEALKDYINVLTTLKLDAYEYSTAMLYAYEYAKQYIRHLEESEILGKCEKDLATILCVE